MPLISKPNYNQIFASQAPEQDKPAVFNNYPEGWGPESRPNNGKPTIKGFNYLQQTSDLKDLWILQNGACLPYDESIEYAEGAPVLKDGLIQYKTTSGFSPAISDKPYILSYFTEGVLYPLNARVMLENGDIVKSTVDGNTVDPNSDMAGWLNLSSATTVATTADLIADVGYKDGQEIFAQSRTAGRHKGGGRFYFDSSRIAENDGVTVFNGWVRSKSEKLKPEWAGAVGDGVTDDTTAFKLINSIGFYRALRNTNISQFFKDNTYVITLDPRAKYVVKGDQILGSPLSTSTSETLKKVGFTLEGNGASILFDPLTENDRLFVIDAFLEHPEVNKVTIYPRRTISSLPVGSGVIFHLNSGYNGKSGARGLHGNGVDVMTVAYEGLANKAKRVFEILGTSQADQMHFQKSNFQYFKEAYYCENSESVNNVFDGSCSFFGGGGAVPSTYFHLVRMNDGLTITDCNLTMYVGDTLFKGRSPLSGSYLTGEAQHRVYFKDNRYEFIGTGDVTMWDSNCWTGVFDGMNLKLAGGGITARAVFKSYELGTLDFNRANLFKTKILSAITSTASYAGSGVAYGVKARDCEFSKPNFELGAYNGSTEYTIKDALVNKRIFKTFDFKSLSYTNSNTMYDFQICPDNEIVMASYRKSSEVTLSKNGQVFGLEFEIPPYQQIDEVYLSLRGALPDDFRGFRLWLGKKSNNIYFDTPNLTPSEIKSRLKLFDGRGVIFTDVITDNVITVDALDASGAVVSLGSTAEVSVKYKALSTAVANITATANAVFGVNNNKPTGYTTTALRPTFGVYRGMQVFDTTLGKPIFVKSTPPIVWCDATGATV